MPWGLCRQVRTLKSFNISAFPLMIRCPPISNGPGKELKFKKKFGAPLPNAGEGSCGKCEKRLLPALSVRRSARSTQVERALLRVFSPVDSETGRSRDGSVQLFHRFRSWG